LIYFRLCFSSDEKETTHRGGAPTKEVVGGHSYFDYQMQMIDLE